MAAPQSILLSALAASPSWDEQVDYMSEEQLGVPGARTEEMQTEEYEGHSMMQSRQRSLKFDFNHALTPWTLHRLKEQRW